MLLSINQISELTGQDRRTITKQLDGLPFQAGDKNAYLYESTEALSRIYAMDTLEAGAGRAGPESGITERGA
jgi:hypothetical protein